MSGPVFNNNISGGQNQINQGMEVNAEMNNSTRTPEQEKRTEDALKVVEESLPNEVSDVVMPQLVKVSRMEPAFQIKEQKPEGKLTKIYDKIKPYVGPVVQKVSIFGAAALSVMKTENPWLAGLFALAEDSAKSKKEQASPPQSRTLPRVSPRPRSSDGGSTFGGR
jgi:hypothetical protein